MSTDKALCRLCALDCEKYVDIYNDCDDSDIDIHAKIATCLQIRVSKEDILPKTVCRICFDKLEESFEFFRTSNKAQSSLQAIYLNASKRKTTSNREKVDGNGEFGVIQQSKLAEDDENSGFETETDDRTQVQEDVKPKIHQQCNQLELADVSLDELPVDCKIEESSSFEVVDEDVAFTKLVTKKTRRRKKEANLNNVPAKPRISQALDGYPWTCTVCEDTVVDSLQELKDHYRVEHQQPPIFKCISCDKQYERYRSFSRHITMHKNPNKYTCDICGKSFNHKTTIQSHAIVHTDERPHVCNTCGKSFKNLSSLTVHEKVHLPNQTKRKFPCDICQREFSAKHSLDNHKNIHTGERGFICDICGRSFYAKASLDYHIRSHTTDKSHVCSTCGKAFRTPGLLVKHTTLHTGIKPHQCDVCGRQFRERGALREHNRIHTGDMPYTCEFCGKCFRFKGILTVHRRQHTGERPYACFECRRYFTNWANYNKHMKRIHHCDTSSRIIAKRRPTVNNVASDLASTESNKPVVTADMETSQCSVSSECTSQI